MDTVKIGPYSVGKGAPPLVIAEAGINHNGHLDVALEMIKVAKEAGADIVKFQTHIADAEMLPDKGVAGEAGSHVTHSLYEIMTACNLSFEAHKTLQAEAERQGILFLSTPFSIEAADLLESVGVPAYKIGSGEVTNLPFLNYIAEKGKPVIVSTGTANWKEIRIAVETIKSKVPGLILMQCTSNYPTPYAEVNLGVLDRMQSEFDTPVGLSDHCEGNYACFGAIAKGASIIEKHFTLSRCLPGIDQSSSLEPHELKNLVDGISAVYSALGDKKELNEEALKVRNGFSESIVTISPMNAGEIFQDHVNVWVKRPGSGIPSYELQNIIGKRASRDLPENYLLRYEDIVD